MLWQQPLSNLKARSKYEQGKTEENTKKTASCLLCNEESAASENNHVCRYVKIEMPKSVS